MTNPPRQKGTRYESELLPKLRLIYGEGVERAPLKGIHDAGDFVHVPYPIEAKARERLSLPEWVATIKRKAGTKYWVLFTKQDRRRTESTGELMVVDADFGRELLSVYEKNRCD